MRPTYRSFGLGAVTFGAAVAYMSYFLFSSVPFAALGIASVILGASALTLPELPVPPGAVRAVVHGSVLNVEALLEEFDAKEKAVYMPPVDGLSVAFIPLHSPSPSSPQAGSDPPHPSFDELKTASRRLVTEAGGVPLLMVFPPGAELIRSSELGDGQSLDEALQLVLEESSELCSSVKAVVTGDRLVVEMSGVKVKTEANRYLYCLGSIPTSLAGSIAAKLMKRGVLLESEEIDDKKSTAVFRLI
jgi:hypothetical protein